MNQIQPTTSRRKEDGMTRPRQSQDAAGMTVAIHRGHHITHIREAGLLEQGGEQQTLQQGHVRALRFRQTASGATIPAMTMVPAPRPAFEEALDPAMRSSLPHDDERPRGMDPGTRPDVRRYDNNDLQPRSRVRRTESGR